MGLVAWAWRTLLEDRREASAQHFAVLATGDATLIKRSHEIIAQLDADIAAFRRAQGWVRG